LAAVKVNINTADRAELELLPGIGRALAGRILDERVRVGRFGRVEDLGRVKGIGGKLIERLRERVTLE
jgi:competence protein ComEA